MIHGKSYLNIFCVNNNRIWGKDFVKKVHLSPPVIHSGKSTIIQESNHGLVYVRSIMRSTMYQKAPFCLPNMVQ